MKTYIFNSKDCVLKEKEPQSLKGIPLISVNGNHWANEIHLIQLQDYEEQRANLKSYEVSKHFFYFWIDGQEVLESEFELKEVPCRHFKDAEPNYEAVPVVEEDIWGNVLKIVESHLFVKTKYMLYAELKSKYNISKK